MPPRIPGIPLGYDLWDGLQCDSGKRLTRLPEMVGPGPADSWSVEGRGEIGFLYPRHGEGGSLISTEDVFTVVWDETTNTAPHEGFDEYRIRSVTDFIDDEQLLQVFAVSAQFDLDRGGFVRRTETDGTCSTRFEPSGRPVSDLVGIVLGTVAQAFFSGVPSYFAAGTIDRASEIIADFVFQDDTGWTALQAIAEKHGAELRVRRNGVINYLVDVLDQVGSTAKTVHFRLGRGLVHLEREVSSEEQVTRVTPVGAGTPPDRATIGENAFTVIGVSGSDLTMQDDVVLEAAQLNGLGWRIMEKDGTIRTITGSTVPNIINVVGHAVATGERIRLRSNAAGDEICDIGSPLAEAALGSPPRSIVGLLELDEIPNINNEIPDGFMSGTYAGGLHTGWTAIGSPTLAEETNSDHVMCGTSSQKVTCPTAGDGIRRALISARPTDTRPFYTPQFHIFVELGRVEVRLVDVTNGITYPLDVADDQPITEGLGWHDFGFQHGISHRASSGEVLLDTEEFAVEITGVDGGDLFFLDCSMLTNTVQGVPNYADDRASNQLFLEGQRALGIRKNPLSVWRARVLDLHRKDAERWPDEPIEMGGDSAIRVQLDPEDDTTAITATARVMSRDRVLEDPLDVTVTLETELQRLTREEKDRRRRDIRRQLPPHAKRPACINATTLLATLGQDLEIEWGRPNGNARTEVKIAGPGGTTQEEFDNGTRLDVVDGTNLVVTASRLALLSITRIVVDTVSPFGKYGRCAVAVDVAQGPTGPCVNVGPSDAAAEQCSPDSTGNLVFHTYQDVDLRALGFQDGDSVNFQFEAKANETGAPTPDVTDLDGIEICEQVGGARRCYVHWVAGTRTIFRTPEFGFSFNTFERAAVAVEIDGASNDVFYRVADAAMALQGTSGADTDHFGDSGFGTFRVNPDGASTGYGAYKDVLYCDRELISISNLPTPAAPGYGVRVERLTGHPLGAKVGSLAQDGDLDGVIDYKFDGWFGTQGANRLHVFTDTDTVNPIFSYPGPVHAGDQFTWDNTLLILSKVQSGVLFSRAAFVSGDIGVLGSGKPIETVEQTWIAVNGELRGSPGGAGLPAKAIINKNPESQGYIECEFLRQSVTESIPIFGCLGTGPGLTTADIGTRMCLQALNSSRVLQTEKCAAPIKTTGYSLSPCIQSQTISATHAIWVWVAERRGADQGIACGRKLQVNAPPGCCAFAPPSGGAPNPGALFFARIISVAVGTCAGTPDVTLRVDWDGDTTTYPDTTHHIRITYIEDIDQTVGNWQRMRVRDNVTFSLKTLTEAWQGSLTGNHDLRGTDAAVTAPHRWRALVELVETGTNTIIASALSPDFSAPTNYGYCP